MTRMAEFAQSRDARDRIYPSAVVGKNRPRNQGSCEAEG